MLLGGGSPLAGGSKAHSTRLQPLGRAAGVREGAFVVVLARRTQGDAQTDGEREFNGQERVELGRRSMAWALGAWRLALGGGAARPSERGATTRTLQAR